MITQERLKELVTYDPCTGLFTSNILRGKLKPGNVCGAVHTKHNKSYTYIGIDLKIYKAHRLVFLYMKGRFPKEQVDHINCNGLDNRFDNLREVSIKENCKNKTIHSDNKSGISGVRFNRITKKWNSQIGVNGKVTYLGSYSDKFEAACVRKSAERKYGYHLNHGMKKPGGRVIESAIVKREAVK